MVGCHIILDDAGKWIEKSNQSNLRFALSIRSLQHLLMPPPPFNVRRRQFYEKPTSHFMCDDEFSTANFSIYLCNSIAENISRFCTKKRHWIVWCEKSTNFNEKALNLEFIWSSTTSISMISIEFYEIIAHWFPTLLTPFPFAIAYDVNNFPVIKILCITYWHNRKGIYTFTCHKW